jgi:AraC family transcriptional regulator
MKVDTRSFYERAVQRAIEHALAHLDAALDLGTLAQEAALSPFHFHRVFRGMVGETPLELVRRVRLERAAHRLRTSDAPVTEVAFDAGYETHEAFTRAFRAAYALSPTGFRGKRPRIELAAPSSIHFDPAGRVSAFVSTPPGGTSMDVQIKQQPALRCFCVRHVGPYNQIPEAFEKLHTLATQAGLEKLSGVLLLGLYHDDPEATPPAELRSDAALVVPEGVPVPDGLVEQRLPAGRYAMTTYVGPYERIGDTWARLLGQWLPASGERIAEGSSYEVYRNTPADVPKEQLVTELYVPLA